ncbi:hypothetical protein PR048_003214 [Dryococelus australis]|uniref:Homeobox domain-containing protein n=1 Tax=Dryococelus australis TaxID=614101 RepID=A0ABQ9INE1_9NEOP|nr:hypothetical protein PR048_003214 [Dryococelus australis]
MQFLGYQLPNAHELRGVTKFWRLLTSRYSEPSRVKWGENGAEPECKGSDDGRSPRKSRRPVAPSGAIPTFSGAIPLGIEPGSPWYGAGYDLAARRKNATRESTATLKAWLNEHKKNPYPTKGEKIMLAIITKMTLTQVSTWFANARRRLKKENKMTWEPKNKTDDDDDAIVSDSDEKDKDDLLMNGDKMKDSRMREDKACGDKQRGVARPGRSQIRAVIIYLSRAPVRKWLSRGGGAGNKSLVRVTWRTVMFPA